MDMVPGPAVLAATLGVVSIPLSLWVLSYSTPRLRAPFYRFIAATLIAFAIFCVATPLMPGGLTDAELAAGVLLLLAAIPLAFVLWSFIAFSFIITMLTRLSMASRPLSVDEWISAYAGGGDAAGITRDRLALLTLARFARIDDRTARITHGGRLAAGLVAGARRLMGLNS